MDDVILMLTTSHIINYCAAAISLNSLPAINATLEVYYD